VSRLSAFANLCCTRTVNTAVLCPNSDKLADVEDALKHITIPKDPVHSRRVVKETLDAVQITCVKPDPETSALLRHAEAIARCFGSDCNSVEDVVARLEAETQDQEWAQATLKVVS
jgi:hypothetical protein